MDLTTLRLALSRMSSAEINLRLAELMGRDMRNDDLWNPCKNWDDVMPVVTQLNVSMTFDGNRYITKHEKSSNYRGVIHKRALVMCCIEVLESYYDECYTPWGNGKTAKNGRLFLVDSYRDALDLNNNTGGEVSAAAIPPSLISRGSALKRLMNASDRLTIVINLNNKGTTEVLWEWLKDALPACATGKTIDFIFLTERVSHLCSFIGADSFNLIRSMPISDALMNTVTGLCNTESREGRNKVFILSKPLIESINHNAPLRECLISKLAATLGVQVDGAPLTSSQA